MAVLTGVVVAAGCKNTTAPDPNRPRTAPINGIQVTEHASPTDTIFIRFNYLGGACDSTAIGVRQTSTNVRLTATTYPTQRPCVNGASDIQNVFHYMVLPYHNAPYTVMFTQPSGTDSVRVVTR
jgi:hypothetical protein